MKKTAIALSAAGVILFASCSQQRVTAGDSGQSTTTASTTQTSTTTQPAAAEQKKDASELFKSNNANTVQGARVETK